MSQPTSEKMIEMCFINLTCLPLICHLFMLKIAKNDLRLFWAKRRKPHYIRDCHTWVKMAFRLGVNSIPVRVTNDRSRKCLFEGISEFLFYPVFGFVRYLSAIAEKAADKVFLRAFFLLLFFLIEKAESEVHCARNSRLRSLEHMRIRIKCRPGICMA